MELNIRRPQREKAPGKSARVPWRLKIVGHANRLKAKQAGFQARTAAFFVFSHATVGSFGRDGGFQAGRKPRADAKLMQKPGNMRKCLTIMERAKGFEPSTLTLAT